MAERQMTGRERPHHLTADKGPSTSQAVAVATLFPVGGILLTLSGLTLTLTVVTLTAVFPLFLLFGPVLLPAAGLIGLALAGFFASGAMGVAAVAALSWVAGQVGQRTKDVGQGIQSRADEVDRAA